MKQQPDRRTPVRPAYAAIALALVVGAGAAWHCRAVAQSHGSHAGQGPASTAASPSTRKFEAANARMHKDMAITFTGDADVDFLQGMIPHHVGAVEMAKVVLKHGKDPEVRKLAQDIIAAQEKEIAWMKEWLSKRQKKAN